MNRVLLLCLVASLGTAGCGFLSDDPALEGFAYEESTHGVTVEPGIDAASIGDGIGVLGTLNTPTPCYTLQGSMDDNGSQLTLRVNARPTSAQSCENIVGAFRYQAAIRNLSAGTYQLRVRHTFEGSTWQPQEFTTSVTVQ